MSAKLTPPAAKAPVEESAEAKALCFVVSPIGQPGSLERRHADFMLKGLIRHVLEPLEYEVRRADDDARPGMISDRVIQDVTKAELVVADLTFLNPNVFWELGVRHSAAKPTIHLALTGTELPFDNFGHDTIFVDTADWESLEAARRRLGDAVRHTMTADYVVSNPITQSNASFAMRHSKDPIEAMVAELNDRVARMSGRIAELERPRGALSEYFATVPAGYISALPPESPAPPRASLTGRFIEAARATGTGIIDANALLHPKKS